MRKPDKFKPSQFTPVESYSQSEMRLPDGSVVARNAVLIDDWRRLIDPVYWPRVLSSGTSAHICGAVVTRRSGKRFFIWGASENMNEFLTPKELQQAHTRFESDVAVGLAEDGTPMPERWIRITCARGQERAIADGLGIALALERSDIDPRMPLVVYAVGSDRVEVVSEEDLPPA